ncbi:MAG TPA: pirin family protein [Cytophagales bacterium]|nr:pirin family protein [Cytophagales bacterium]HAA21621.1 pirin family protein [Cytophagales bacterium]HAP62848.1 pirin family protein [Cytophagales bacterium]
MALKKVARQMPVFEIDMGGIPVKQALPTQRVEQIDPFLLLHHGKFDPMQDRPARQQGVGPHPHRGFSPVTFVIQGEVHHQDSRGNSQVAKAGDVQWMHAGMGIIHSERPTEASIEAGELQEIIQLWINSPGAKKMLPPDYQHVPREEMPVFASEDGLLASRLIAGEYAGKQGPIRTQSDLLVHWGEGKAGGTIQYTIPEGFNTTLYLVKGRLRVEGTGLVEPETLLLFDQAGDTISLEAKSDAQFLLLSGRPLEEKVVQQGPFVMNSETQIMEAMRDYQMGKMGFLVEEY